MIEQQGRVIRLEGDKVSVQIGSSPGCPACDAGKGCGAGIFVQMLRRKPALVQVNNAVNANLGQVVTLAIPERVFLRLVLRLYLVPLLSGVAGAALGQYFANLAQVNSGTADGMSLFAAVFPFALALYLGRGGQLKLTRALNIRLLDLVQEPSAASQCQSNHGDADGRRSAVDTEKRILPRRALLNLRKL